MSSIRRSQVIAPFGVGAIHILKGARAVVTAGLDFWFEDRNSGNSASGEQLAAVRIEEPRLQKELDVSHFRMPPGPESRLPGQAELEVPLFRFPTWHVCPRCGLMREEKLTAGGFFECQLPACNKEKLIQVRFAAACDAGHLQDFPWREWVHRDATPACNGDLQYQAGGSGSLEDISIQCMACKKQRTLAGAMSGAHARDDEKTQPWSALTSRLLSKSKSEDKGEDGGAAKFPCPGGRVWLGERNGGICNQPLRAILINATNVHYAKISSALWIPPGGITGDILGLRRILDETKFRTIIRLRRSLEDSDEVIIDHLRAKFPDQFGTVAVETLKLALQDGIDPNAELPETLTGEAVLRFPEYSQLQIGREAQTTKDDLVVRVMAREFIDQALDAGLASKIECLSLVDKLRETRALYGFARLLSEKPPGALPYQQMLWKNWPTQRDQRWLPASVVYGEGIFVRFSEGPIQKWEQSETVLEHIKPLQERYRAAEKAAGRAPDTVEARVSPRYILLHTLAHLLMRRLTFDCGYGSSSLRERLYVSDANDALMAGILIYTAAGDSEGSLGGLVRMGDPGNFAKILSGAIDDAKWCSSDPVCTEAGNLGGQGTDGLNVAACHCCALMPETSCESFNKLLDRQLLTGVDGKLGLGFFEVPD